MNLTEEQLDELMKCRPLNACREADCVHQAWKGRIEEFMKKPGCNAEELTKIINDMEAYVSA